MNYEEKCLAADKELAKLLGWEWHEGSTKHRTGETWDEWEWIGPNGAEDPSTGFCRIRWTMQNDHAFEILVNQEMDIYWELDAVVCYDPNNELKFKRAVIKEFPDKMAAVRYVIVVAAINKMKDLK